jgi:hypothetical protein
MPVKRKVKRTSSNPTPLAGRAISRRKAIEAALAVVALGDAGSASGTWVNSMSSYASKAASACLGSGGPGSAYCSCVYGNLQSSIASAHYYGGMPNSVSSSLFSELSSDYIGCTDAGGKASNSYWQFS